MKKMRLKSNKKLKIKYLIYIFIIYISFAYTFYYSLRNSKNITNENFINILMENGSFSIKDKYNITNIVNNTVNYLFNINFKNPASLFNNTIFSKQSIYVDISYDDDYSNMDELQKISKYISDPNPVDINNPIIYIYNSHQLENYDNYNLDIYGITPNVLMASYILKEKLNQKGLSTIVETTNLTDFLNANGWDYSSSYSASRLLILNNINKYDSLKYFIDIHRDSVSKDISTITINNKSYAKILFVLGLEHNNYQENLEFMESLNLLFEKYYPGLSRGIYKKSGPGVDGIYNQDINGNVILIEVGAVDNNINEVFNTIDALSDILYYYINGENNE